MTTRPIPEEELIALRMELRRRELAGEPTVALAADIDDSHVVASTVRATQPPATYEPSRSSIAQAPVTPIASPLAESVDHPFDPKAPPPIKTLVSAQEDPLVADVISRAHAARSTQAPAVRLEGVRVPESNPPPTLPALDPSQQPSIPQLPPVAGLSAPPPAGLSAPPPAGIPPAPGFGLPLPAPTFGPPPPVLRGSTVPFPPETPADPTGHRLLITVAALSFVVVLGLGLSLFLWLRPAPSPNNALGPAASGSAPAETAATSFAAPSKSAPDAAQTGPAADPTSPEGQARMALEKLRTGVDACVREHIHVLPGTSPAVPQSFALLQNGPFQSSPRMWWTPVWSCASFQWNSPQSFQIQWQMLRVNLEGQGVAYLDLDHDGRPDRALGFKATVKQAGQVELGPIEVLSEIPPIAKWIQ